MKYSTMAGIDVRLNRGTRSMFQFNAINLTKEEAEAEANRRTLVEYENGNIGVHHYAVVQDYREMLRKK